MYTKRKFIIALELLAADCGIFGHDGVAREWAYRSASFCHPRCQTRLYSAFWFGFLSRDEQNQQLALLNGCEREA